MWLPRHWARPACSAAGQALTGTPVVVQDMMQLSQDGGSKAELGRPILSAGLCFDFHKVGHTTSAAMACA